MENFAQKMRKDIYSRYVEPSGEIRQGLSERDVVNLLRTSELMDNTTYRTLMEILFAIDPDEKWERFCIGYLYPDYAWQKRLCKSGKTNIGSQHEHNLKPPEVFFKIYRLITFHEMIFGDIVRNLKERGMVGVAKGKAEFGPRALGNRSLLADPSILNMKDKVNKVKGREEFRPFAPMILKEDVDIYFESGIPSPFMNTIRKAKPVTIKKYPSIVHLDGTSRLQEVTEEPYRTLLAEWKKETGCPMLLNTSLNVKGEPIVNTEIDAKNFQSKTGVKVL